jgi:hypothetical protein
MSFFSGAGKNKFFRSRATKAQKRLPVPLNTFLSILSNYRILIPDNSSYTFRCASLQRPQLVTRLSGNHKDRNVAVGFDRLQTFHHLKSVHSRHLQIEQDQVIAILEVKPADFARFIVDVIET